jgi:hypothetical protein
MVNSGTTITWEAWDLKYKPNQDWNHAWGAAPANLLPRFVLGAQPLEAGWKRAKICPYPGDLTSARGKIPTPRGPILVDWKKDDTFKISITLPDGVFAKVELPASENSSAVHVNGTRVEAERQLDRWIIDDEVTGTVTIEVK